MRRKAARAPEGWQRAREYGKAALRSLLEACRREPEPCCLWEGSNRCCENYPPTCDCEEERFEAFRAGWSALAAARRPDSAEMHAAFARHLAYNTNHPTDSAVENGSTP